FNGPTRAEKLINSLVNAKVHQVAFFATSNFLDKEGIARLKRYNDAGHIIANHMHTHPNINTTSLIDYQNDFLAAHSKLKDFSNFKPWFRFPYLREGDTLNKRDGMRQTLVENGYTNAYITLNNYDWYIEVLFQRAIKQGFKIDMAAMREFYVSILMESIDYYDQMALRHLGRSPKHVILLHEMDVTALFIGDLVNELRKQGWSIITPSEAYTDRIAQYQTTNLFKFNPGRIGEIAKDHGRTKGLWHSSLNEQYLEKQFQMRVLKLDQN
ncbi:MAG: polysaccharide deacetylase family protein, partial [Kangiellaceae bacterium]|nr:polysaccharide deacetylase family protein [Kangiellaceae bacterium]